MKRLNFVALVMFLLMQLPFLGLKAQNIEVNFIKNIITRNFSASVSENKASYKRFECFLVTVIKNKNGELLDVYYLKSASFKGDDSLKSTIEKVKLNWIKKPTTYTTIYLPFIIVNPEDDNLGEEQNNIKEAENFVKLINNVTRSKEVFIAKPYYNLIIGEPKQRK
jgi:hypothetical protein